MFARLKKIAAATVGAALLVGGGAVAAQAQPASIVDKDLTGNIHLVKYDDSAGLSAPQGIKTKVEAKTLAGIDFKLTKINKAGGEAIDLNSAKGRKAAAKLNGSTVAANKAEYGVGEKADFEGTTDANGKIDWTGVPVGVYLLEETNSKAADGKVYKAAAPSILFIPTTDPTDPSKWIMDGKNYGLWVYPKNSLENNEKKVVDAKSNVGDKITYTVTASIPAVQKDEKGNHNLTDFWFQDQLDPKLDLAEGDVELKVGDTKLEAGTDYNHKVFPAKDGKGQVLEVFVTPAGRAKIAEAKLAKSDTVVTLTFEPTVKESGIIANEALVYKNTGEGGGKTNPPGDTPQTPPEGTEKTNVTVTAYGKIKVVKTDDKGKALKGAEFQVFRKDNLNEPVEVNGQTTFKTNEDGIVEIDGLHVTDYVDDAAAAKPGDTVPGYVLVETKAPAGYELIPSPIDFDLKIGKVEKIKVKLDAEGKEIAKSAEEISSPAVNNEATETVLTADATVINFEALPKLPLTGGTGVALFGILGALVIAGGVYASRKKA